MTETRERFDRAARRYLKPGGKIAYGAFALRTFHQMRSMLRYYSSLGFVVLPKFECEHCGSLEIPATPNEILPTYVCSACAKSHNLARSGGNVMLGWNGTEAELAKANEQVKRELGQELPKTE